MKSENELRALLGSTELDDALIDEVLELREQMRQQTRLNDLQAEENGLKTEIIQSLMNRLELLEANHDH